MGGFCTIVRSLPISCASIMLSVKICRHAYNLGFNNISTRIVIQIAVLKRLVLVLMIERTALS